MFTRLLLFLCAVSASATTTVYLRDGAPPLYQITNTATVSGTVQIATQAAHGLSANDLVNNINICGTTNANTRAGHLAFRVRAVQDSTHFTVEELDTSAVTLNAAWCQGTFDSDWSGGPQFGGKVHAYTLPDGPKGGSLDGWTGPLMRKITIRPSTGLVSLDSTSNVLTAVLNFNPDLAVGEKAGWWGTTSTNLNDSGRPWTVATKVVGSPNTTLTFTSGTAASITNGSYLTNNTCGPSSNAECVSLSILGWSGNSYLDGAAGFDLNSSCISYGGFYTYTDTYLMSCGIKHLINPADVSLINTTGGVKDLLNHIEIYSQYAGGTWWADETQPHGGNGTWGDFGSDIIQRIGLIYSIYGEWLTPTERQTLADKLLNDLEDPGGCVKNLLTVKSGTVTLSGTTLTGSGTHFLTDLAVGGVITADGIGADALQSYPSPDPASHMYRVTAVASDTSATVQQIGFPGFDGTPRVFWSAGAWAPGKCGGVWMKKHWQGSVFSHPVNYPENGGGGAWPGPYTGGGANNMYTENWGLMGLGAAFADLDPRALALFQREQDYFFDRQLPWMLMYNTGFSHSGNGYSYAKTQYDGLLTAEHLLQLVPAFPSMDMANLSQRPYVQIMYGMVPDKRGATCAGSESIMWYGDGAGGDGCFFPYTGLSVMLNENVAFTLNRADPISKKFNDWLAVRGMNSSWLQASYAAGAFTHMDPRTARIDYTTQPTQYTFKNTSASTCAALGIYCPAMSGDAVISRTGWTNADDTQVVYESRSWAGDHDRPSHGGVRIYKRGDLLHRDGRGENVDSTTGDTVLELSAGSPKYNVSSPFTPSNSFITRSLSDSYGDPSSRYAYAMTDMGGIFSTPPTYAQRHFFHFKVGEEVVVQVDKVDASNLGGSAKWRLHYKNNGGGGGPGTTTCPGSGGCGSLNTNRTILSVQNNVSPQVFGVGSKIMSPGTITVQDDGDSWGGNFSTHRVTICGGASCGASPILKSVVIHRVGTIASGLTLTTSAPLSDSTHYVVRADDKIVGMSTDDSLVSGYPSHTIPSGITQALYVDMAPGTYSATIGGMCVVVADDNSCYLEPNGTGGTMTITAGAGTAPTITTSSLPNGTNGVAYSQTLTATGDIPITWSITVGAIPAWANLNTTTGAITGTPNAVATTSFTVTATNATGSDSKALSITIVAASTAGSVVRATGVRGTIIK